MFSLEFFMSLLVSRLLSKIYDFQYKSPQNDLKIIAVTGSYGKTITAHMIYHILKNSGIKVSYITSMGFSPDGKAKEDYIDSNILTMKDLYSALSIMRDNDVEYVVIEVSPLVFKENIFENIFFDYGIVTNTHLKDLSNFQSIEEYLELKLKFIKKIKNGGYLVINGEETSTLEWLNNRENEVEQQIYSFVTNKNRAEVVEKFVNGLIYKENGNIIKLPAAGFYSINHSQAAIHVAKQIIAEENAIKALESFKMPKGRMEVVLNSPYTVVIDYAYNPQMMKKSLEYLHSVKSPFNKLITVFGAAGERDKIRRKMGEVAAEMADLIILAAEDPKGESVYDINSDIHSHAEKQGAVIVERISSTDELEMIDPRKLKERIKNIAVNSDIPVVAFDNQDYTSRLDAIKFALAYADPNDIIYISGKGHEDTLTFDKTMYEWSDHDAVQTAIESINSNL